MAESQPRPPGLSIRLKLALSYALFLIAAAWVTFLAVVAVVLRHLPSGHIYVYGAGTFAANRADLIRLAMPYAVAGTVLLAVIGLGGGWLLAGRMLRPLAPISDAAVAAARGSLSHRIRLPGPDDELRHLADVFDEMLARLERSFEEQRRFTANASHELRTPQAAMKTILEVAQADPDPSRTKTRLTQLTDLNGRSIAIVEALLRLARVDGGGLELAVCDLAEIADHALEPLTEASTDRQVETNLMPATVVGDPGLLEQMATNLVLNAERHNLPSGGWIRVVTYTDHNRAVLEVENTGAPVDPGTVGTLVEPFVRGGGRIASRRGATGSGLGLSLVASVVRVHGGELAMTPRVDGGLLVTVRIPSSVPRDGHLRR